MKKKAVATLFCECLCTCVDLTARRLLTSVVDTSLYCSCTPIRDDNDILTCASDDIVELDTKRSGFTDDDEG